MSRQPVYPFIALLVLALASSAAPARAGENDKSSPPKASEAPAEDDEASEASPFMQAVSHDAKRKSVPVYGNDDLERMFGSPAPAPAGKPAAAVAAGTEPAVDQAAAGEPSALDQVLEAEANRRDLQQQIEEAKQGVAEARTRVAEAEKRSLATRNPLLPRPEVPPEEAEAWNAADGTARASKADQDLAAAREALAKAEQDLATLQGSAP